MSTATVNYTGNLRTECTHVQSGQKIHTDAPIDNKGLGEAFSPTDLMSTSLATCMITIMGIAANERNIPFADVRAEVQKIMGSNPRRVVKIQIELFFPDNGYSDKTKELLKHAALNCPVAKSLHPELVMDVKFHFGA